MKKDLSFQSLLFARAPDEACIFETIGTWSEEKQKHVSIVFQGLPYPSTIGDLPSDEQAENATPLIGMTFFLPESIDVVIDALQRAKERLLESEADHDR